MRRIVRSDNVGWPFAGGVVQSDEINAYVFSGAGTALDTVPAGANFVRIGATPGAAFFVKMGAAAVVPTGNVTDGSASEANPSMFVLDGETEIGIAVPAACIVTLAYYG